MDEDDWPARIDVSDHTGRSEVATETIREAVRCALARLKRHDAHIGIALVDDEEIARLHGEFLGKDGPTDCITFDLSEDADFDNACVEGDVVVSIETAAREATRRGHSLAAETCLYSIHGVLHLLGYDDLNDEDAARMHALEDEILTDAGFGPVYSVNGA